MHPIPGTFSKILVCLQKKIVDYKGTDKIFIKAVR